MPFWLWPDSRFGQSIITRVQSTVHVRYPCGTCLAPHPPSCWQSPCTPSRDMRATEVGDVVGRASHRAVADPACHPRQPLIAQWVTASCVTRRSKTSSLYGAVDSVSRRRARAIGDGYRYTQLCNGPPSASPRLSVTASALSRMWLRRDIRPATRKSPGLSLGLHHPAARESDTNVSHQSF